MLRANRPKLALVKPAKESIKRYYGWCDGLWGALKELHKDYIVKVFGYSDQDTVFERDGIEFQLNQNMGPLRYRLFEGFEPDVILGWGTTFHSWEEIAPYKDKFVDTPRLLLYGGGPIDQANAYKHFNHVFVENESDAKEFPRSVSVAFGTNTDVFKPMKIEKVYPAFFPAAFARWKRHYLFAEAMPKGSLCVGEHQPHEMDCVEVVLQKGHTVLPEVSNEILPWFYNSSLGVCLTPEHMGGCQRAALEAMACNVPVLATNDSKAAEFDGVWACPPTPEDIRAAYHTMVLTFENEEFNLRDQFIVGKLDHVTYASKIREQIKRLL